MLLGRYLRCLLLLAALVCGRIASVSAQEIPLERCDALSLVRVEIDGRPMHFLVDTAATTLLNLASFSEGRGRDVRITSWTGTTGASAREIRVNGLTIGQTTLILLTVPAIDLSAIGKACGSRIDGVLGADLLAKIGATIDLKRRTMHLITPDEEHGLQLVSELNEEMLHCIAAFNDSDERSFADCLEPQITLATGDRALAGRSDVLQYFREYYFHQTPAAKLEMSASAFHPLGEALWYGYEFTIQSVRGSSCGRGVALCRKSAGRWRVASMQQIVERFEPGSE